MRSEMSQALRGAVLIMIAAIGACSSSPVPSFSSVIATGTTAGVAWKVNAEADNGQLCLLTEIVGSNESGGACGPAAAPSQPFQFAGGSGAGPDEPVLRAGLVRNDVGSVVIEMGNGEIQPAQLTSLASWGIDAQAFAVGLPPGSAPVWFVVLDRDGTELWRGKASAGVSDDRYRERRSDPHLERD